MELDEQDDDGAASHRGEDRLIHALLMHVYDEHAADHREARVQRSIAAIAGMDRSQASSTPSLLGSWLRNRNSISWIRLGTAAAALIAIGIWASINNPTIASAAIEKIVAALGSPGDRTYHIDMIDLPEPPGRRAPRGPESVPRPGLDGATLYLRDANQYVLVRHDPRGGRTFDGYDGRQSWRVRRGRVEEVREGLGAGGIPMPPLMANVPFTDLHGALERIQSDYEIEHLDLADTPAGEPALTHLRARRKSRWVKGPDTIEIWADPVTGLPHRIVFDDAKVQGSRTPCRITLTLEGDQGLPADWFRPEAHVNKDNREFVPALNSAR